MELNYEASSQGKYVIEIVSLLQKPHNPFSKQDI